jgi:hypothetical protein
MHFLEQKAVAILARCEEPFKKNKLNNLRDLLTNLKQSNFFIFLAANSDLPQEIISISDFYLQTKNWRDGANRYGPSTHIKTEMILKIAQYHGFEKILLNEYDAPVNFDYSALYDFLDNKMESLKLDFIGSHWQPNAVATGIYFTKIKFLLETVKFANFQSGFESFELHTEQNFGSYLFDKNIYLYPSPEAIYHEIDKSIFSSQKYQHGGQLELDEETKTWKTKQDI